MKTNALPFPYTESGLIDEQAFMRENASAIVNESFLASDFLTDNSVILGYADNGISAVICFVESDEDVYALKISTNRNLREIYKLQRFLEANDFRYGVNVYDFIDINYQDASYECMVMEFVDSVRASYIELSDDDRELLFKELGRIIAQLHSIPVEGYGFVSMNEDGVLSGKSESIGAALRALTEEVEPDEKLESCIASFENSSIKPVLTHHALGLHNVFYNPETKEIKIFDFKSQLLPLEFDLAMFIIWNRWLGEDYIDMFLDSYGRDNFDQDMLNKALYIEYKRKLATWYKRVKNNKKAQVWIAQGENEVLKLTNLI